MVGDDPNSNGDGATLVPSGGRLRVLHIVAPAEFGGLERVVHSLAMQLVERRHDVHVAVLLHDSGESHPFADVFCGTDVRTHVVRLPARAYAREHRTLRDLIRQCRPDVVHTHGYRCDIIGRRAAAAEGVATVTTSHGFSRGGLVNRVYEWVQRREFRSFAAVVAVSASMAEELLGAGVPPEHLEVMPNAVPVMSAFLDRAEARRRLGISIDDFRIGWVGRFAWAKGVDVFVRSLDRVSAARWSASIIGEGGGREAAMLVAEDLGLVGRITWHGMVADAASYLAAFDALVISSRTEGTPMILLEAMAAGVPVIATAVGGIPDVVSTADALLVQPDDPAALAAAIDEVSAEPDAAADRVARARGRLAAYNRADWAARYENLYRRVAH